MEFLKKSLEGFQETSLRKKKSKASLMEFMQDFFIEFIVLGDLHERIPIKNPLGNCE